MSRAIYEYLEEIDFRLLHGTRSGVEVHYRLMPLSRNLGSPMYRASDQPAVYMQSRILVPLYIEYRYQATFIWIEFLRSRNFLRRRQFFLKNIAVTPLKKVAPSQKRRGPQK